MQQDKGVSLPWKVVELLAKITSDVTAATRVCGRGGKEGGRVFGVSDVVAKHMLVMV